MNGEANLKGSRFEFKVARRPIWLGLIGGIVLLTCLGAWAWWTGRLKHADTTYVLIMLSCVIGSVSFVGWRILANGRKTALSMGAIELDAEGICWRRGDYTVAFETSWDVLAHAIVDRRNRQILLQQHDAKPFLIRSGSGCVELERLHDLERLIASRVPIERAGSNDSVAGPGVLLYGIVSILASIALYAANVGLAAVLHWTRLLAVMPVLVGATGLIVVVAGLRISSGSGPMVSPLYGVAYPRVVVRFLVVASVANFVIVAAINGLRP